MFNTVYSQRWEIPLYMFITFILLAVNWPAIDRVNYEIGDFAANSLLVQDAKSFSLLVGHYSRIGFNHPGPAILYVLALGELIFYDGLHIVKSGFSGQLVAVALYNAFWIVLIFRLIQKITGSFSATLLTSATFLLVAALFDYQFFMGIWLPHLYFFPFAVMLFSASRLTNGYTDSLLSLALSLGFLFNGHVGFMAIISIIFLIILSFNYIFFRKNEDKFLLSKKFLLHNKKQLFIFFGVLFLFFIPLIIQTIIDFPGPITDYIVFSGGKASNSIIDAIQYMLFYWNGSVFFLMGFVLLLIISFAKLESKEMTSNIRGLSLLIFAATVAFLFYAKFGIDLLDQKYIGLFYYVIPALTLAMAVMYLHEMIKIKNNKILALGFSLVFLCGLYLNINKAPNYIAHYNEPDIMKLYTELNKVKSDGRLVLDLDNTHEWEYIWAHIAGLAVYAQRNNNELFCINKNWHILFTKDLICTSDELLNNKKMLVKKTLENNVTIPPVVELLGLSFYPV